MHARVTFLALCVVTDATNRITQNQPAATIGLRLALAHLYAIGDRRKEWFDRQPYETIWRYAVEGAQMNVGSADSSGRVQQMTAAFNGIARAAGMDADVPTMRAIGKALRST